MEAWLDGARVAAREAGRRLMGYFGKASLSVERKPDESEVTEADKDVSDFLSARLPLVLVAPVLSEEAIAPFEARRNWGDFWLVDPLDGTRDFIAGSREFCVCVALVREGRPVLGVLDAPALGESYFALRGKGAFREVNGRTERLRLTASLPHWIAARSPLHDGPELDTYLRQRGISGQLVVGAALKFARIAEGKANLFVRLKPCGEWDVAAGQVLLEEAGGTLVRLKGGGALAYNTPEATVPDCVAFGFGKRLSDLG